MSNKRGTITWPVESFVRHIALRVCTSTELFSILQHVSHLRTFETAYLVMMDINKNELVRHLHLSSLRIQITRSVSFESIKLILEHTPSLVHLKIIVTIFDENSNLTFKSLSNGSVWEKFIEENLRLLDKFEFLFETNFCDENPPLIETLIEPFQTPFWLQHKHWLVHCDCAPSKESTDSNTQHDHIPVIACNTDLVFKAAVDLPRFGRGAFLTCLERLYKSISGNDLKYTAFVGKTYSIQYQYAEMIANKIALVNDQPQIEKVYFIGDNPDGHIVGANMYDHVLKQSMNLRTGIRGYSLLSDSQFLSAAACESILVCSGVYEPNKQKLDGKKPRKLPITIQLDVFEAVKYILFKETCPWIASY
ncbi:unnamed protein product [Rotaria sp. Silwood2]|nr:unnamed protein product [Rotaria sp. Silwood2]CAF3095162.1 unnamed protein product [Rotaria sp. Silwood2]CAF4443719.1 unnamed protein product [Rotaria sp. Silwood2]